MRDHATYPSTFLTYVIVIPPEALLSFELLAADGAVEGGLLVELEVHPQGRVLRAHLSANVAPVRRDGAFCLIYLINQEESTVML